MIYRIAEGWTDIIALAACYRHLVGLRADGQCNAEPLFTPPFL